MAVHSAVCAHLITFTLWSVLLSSVVVKNALLATASPSVRPTVESMTTSDIQEDVSDYCAKTVIQFNNVSRADWDQARPEYFSLVLGNLLGKTQFFRNLFMSIVRIMGRRPEVAMMFSQPIKILKPQKSYDEKRRSGWIVFKIRSLRQSVLANYQSIHKETPKNKLYGLMKAAAIRDELVLKRTENFESFKHSLRLLRIKLPIPPDIYTYSEFTRLMNGQILSDDEDDDICLRGALGVATTGSGEATTAFTIMQHSKRHSSPTRPAVSPRSTILPSTRTTELPVLTTIAEEPGKELAQEVASDSSGDPVLLGVYIGVPLVLCLLAVIVIILILRWTALRRSSDKGTAPPQAKPVYV